LPAGGLITLLFIAEPHIVVVLLLGSKFAAYSQYLRGLSIALFLLSIANLFIYYHIGRRHYLIAPAVAVGLIGTVFLLQYRHGTMGAVVGDLEESASLILLLVLGLSLRYNKRFLGKSAEQLAA
jgi:hypothetical protein